MHGTTAAAVLAIFLFTGAAAPVAAADGGFYLAAPHELHGRPGTLIRSETIPAPPQAAAAYRILYRSVGLKGEPVAVSGVVAIPAGGVAGTRPLVAWAHPTSGIATGCAPSMQPDVFQRIPGLPALLAAGAVVVATDYPGLGTAGVHPYLVGPSEAHAVLDSARAARALPDSGAGSRLVVWGFSQGGHAALWSGTMAHSYAPELKLVGIAAEAPPTELGTLLRADLGGPAGKVLSAFALRSWSASYGIALDGIVEQRVALVLDRIARQCSESFADMLNLAADEAPIEREGYLSADVTVTQPWRGLIEGNTPGITPPGVPVLIAQGGADSIVRPLVTSLYMDELCSHGVPVRFVLEPGAEHTDMPARSAGTATAWITARFDAAPAPNDCRRP